MKKVLAAVAAALLAAFASSDSHAFEFGARGAYWFPDLSGEVQTSTGGAKETRIDLKDTLGVGDENLAFGEAFLSFGKTTLRVGYSGMKFDGRRTLSGSVTFDGVTYPASETVDTRIDLRMLDAGLQYDLLRPDVGVASVRLGLLLQVKYVDGEVELRGSTTGDALEDFRMPIPMVGVAIGAGILKNTVRVDLRAAGIAYSGNHLYDVDACASFSPFPFLRIQGGYRLVDLEVDEDEILAALKLKGPYAGVQVSF